MFMEFKVGDAVRVMPGAKLANGKEVSKWVFDTKLFVRAIEDEEHITLAKHTTGAITGVFKLADLTEWHEDEMVTNDFESYVVRIAADVLKVYAGPGTNFKTIKELKRNYLNTIIAEKNGWGKLKIGGWIDLSETKKI